MRLGVVRVWTYTTAPLTRFSGAMDEYKYKTLTSNYTRLLSWINNGAEIPISPKLTTISPSLRLPSSHCIVQFPFPFDLFHQIRPLSYFPSSPTPLSLKSSPPAKFIGVRCSEKPIGKILRICKNCKTQFDPSLNHPRAFFFHTAHFGGETKRKFESVYSGGTMNTPNSGQVLEYWHCCGSEDPFDPGCTAAPHASYDD